MIKRLRYSLLFIPLFTIGISFLAISPPSLAMMGKDLFGDNVTAAKCRVCHVKRFEKGDSPLAEWLQWRNPNKHHLKVGKKVECPTGPPGADLGDVYDCTSCHRFVWNSETVSYKFDVFRDCLYCHDVNTVTGPPMSNRHPMMGRPCNVCHGITIYEDGTYDYTNNSGGMRSSKQSDGIDDGVNTMMSGGGC